MAETPTPLRIARKPRTQDKKPRVEIDEFLATAKIAVANNYNTHRRPGSFYIPPSSMRVTWYTQTLGNWKAMITAEEVPSLLWIVSYDSGTGEIHLDYYRKITNAIISSDGKPVKQENNRNQPQE